MLAGSVLFFVEFKLSIFFFYMLEEFIHQRFVNSKSFNELIQIFVFLVQFVAVIFHIRQCERIKCTSTCGIAVNIRNFNCVDRNENIWHNKSEEHTSELQSQFHLLCRLLLEKKIN